MSSNKIILILLVLFLNPFWVFARTIVPGGNVSGNWNALGSPYMIQGEIIIDNYALLIIEPGVEIIFQGHYKFIVNGLLFAQGTEADSIRFTTDNPEIGWFGVRFINAPDSSLIEYCIFEYGRASGGGNDRHGGGIFCDNSNPTVKHCLFHSNWAEVHGAGFYCTNSSPKIAHCAFNENISHNYQGAKGGGVGFEFSDIVIRDCVFRDNYAGDDGGAIYSFDSESVITNCTIVNNSCIEWGGGICNGWDSNMTIRNCELIGNYGGDGGGIYFFDSDAVIDNCVIRDNFTEGGSLPYSHNDGGGIFMGYNAGSDGSNLTLINSIIEGNSALRHGGGIYCGYLSSIYVYDSSLIDNSSVENGGGIYSSSISNTNIFLRCKFTNNIAGGYGGGIFSQAEVTRFSKCVISSNQSRNTGGGCVINSEVSSFNNCTFYTNSAQLFGGAIHFYNVPANLVNSIVAENLGNSSVHLTNTPSTEIFYSSFYDNQGSNFSGTLIPPGIGNIVNLNLNGDSCDVYNNIYLDPLFTDPFSGNFRLSENSPCIDAGNPLFRLDPDSTISDMGAVYYDQSERMVSGFVDKQIENYTPMEISPNPFNSSTNIRFETPAPGDASLIIYDISGRQIAVLMDEFVSSGQHDAVFDGANLSSGIYFARLQTEGFTAVQKLLLLK